MVGLCKPIPRVDAGESSLRHQKQRSLLMRCGALILQAAVDDQKVKSGLVSHIRDVESSNSVVDAEALADATVLYEARLAFLTSAEAVMTGTDFSGYEGSEDELFSIIRRFLDKYPDTSKDLGRLKSSELF